MDRATALLRRILLAAALLSAAARPGSAHAETTGERVARAARAQVDGRSYYTPDYVRLSYPGGDVPDGTGICADVVVRAYRQGAGIDLQRLVHEDMTAHFPAYPSRRVWGLARPDRNIDHRRVLNLNAFFRRHGRSLSLADSAGYQPGDIVSWNLRQRGSLPHIGIVAAERGPSGRAMVIHNIGNGPRLEDALFDWTIIGHYRYP